MHLSWFEGCHIYFCWGECPLELAQRLPRVALAAHPSGKLRAVLSLQVHAQWHND
jgi:hypothetical protein